MPKLVGREKIKEVVKNLGYIYINDHLKNKSKRYVVIEDKMGYRYDFYFNHLGKHVPNFVDKSNPFTLSWNIPLWLKLNNSQFELLEGNEYKGSSLKLNLYCNKCKDYPRMSWGDISQKAGCGICHGLQVGLYHNLAVQRPDLAKEWHPTKNGNLTPKDITYGSKKKVYWLCSNGHRYLSSINDRTNGGNSCPTCSNQQKESSIATELKSYILSKYNSKEEYQILKNDTTNRWLPYDIYIFGGENPEVNGIYIEIHWEQHYKITWWHKKIAENKNITPEEEFEYQKYKDRLKKNFAKKNGTYIEIDLRKIKTIEQAIGYVEDILQKYH